MTPFFLTIPTKPPCEGRRENTLWGKTIEKADPSSNRKGIREPFLITSSMGAPTNNTLTWPLRRYSTSIGCGEEMEEVAYMRRNRYRVWGGEEPHVAEVPIPQPQCSYGVPT